MSTAELRALDSATFDTFVAGGDGIILFRKPACPHCAVMGAVLAKIQGQQPDLRLAAVNSEAFPDLMEKAGVERVPTVCAVKNGTIRGRQTGVFNPRETIAFFANA